MAPEIVEAGVGLGFEKIAAETAARSGNARGATSALRGGSAAGGAGGAATDAWANRRDFARNYLRKLINLEVTLPLPSDKQADALLTRPTGERRPSYAKRLEKWVRANRFLLLLPVLAATVAIAMRLATMVPATPESQPAANVSRASGVPEANGGPVPAMPAVASVRPEKPLLDGQQTTSTDDPVPDDRRWWGWIFWVPLLPLSAVVWWVVTRRPDAVVQDSVQFLDALHIWHRPIANRRRTPRELNRFLNFVRFSAMRFRSAVETRTPFERALDSVEKGVHFVLKRVSHSRGAEAADPSLTASSAASDGVNEAMLVAMAAITPYLADLARRVDYEDLARADAEIAYSLENHRHVFERLPTEAEWDRYRELLAGTELF
jgi:hypothetical protein